jgi:type I restriction enzyme, S subunit
MTRAWPLVRLGDVLLRHKDSLDIEDDEGYTRLTIRMNGQGVGIRDKVCGREIGTKRQFRVKAGQFLLSKIDARNGAFGLVPNDCDNAIVTGNFWAFDISTDRVVPRFIDLLTKTTLFVDYSIKASSGTTNRLYLQEEKFAEQQIELPPIEEQKKIVARIDTVQQKMQAADKLRASIDKDIASLLAVRFQETLKQAPLLPMREVAPLVRRNVQLEPNQQYKELGARSFGKGLFVKPDFDADAATWEKPVWIKVGDIVFSNIKAWEGAIGVAKPEHDGFIASHRYLTAVVKPEVALPEYLLYYLLSETGLTAVNEASPGTADRNRTTKQSTLEAICVPVPLMAIQKQFVKLKYALEQAAEVRTKQMVSVEAMLPALCNQVLSQQ